MDMNEYLLLCVIIYLLIGCVSVAMFDVKFFVCRITRDIRNDAIAIIVGMFLIVVLNLLALLLWLPIACWRPNTERRNF